MPSINMPLSTDWRELVEMDPDEFLEQYKRAAYKPTLSPMVGQREMLPQPRYPKKEKTDREKWDEVFKLAQKIREGMPYLSGAEATEMALDAIIPNPPAWTGLARGYKTPEKRTVLGEMFANFVAGATYNIPRMAANAGLAIDDFFTRPQPDEEMPEEYLSYFPYDSQKYHDLFPDTGRPRGLSENTSLTNESSEPKRPEKTPEELWEYYRPTANKGVSDKGREAIQAGERYRGELIGAKPAPQPTLQEIKLEQAREAYALLTRGLQSSQAHRREDKRLQPYRDKVRHEVIMALAEMEEPIKAKSDSEFRQALRKIALEKADSVPSRFDKQTITGEIEFGLPDKTTAERYRRWLNDVEFQEKHDPRWAPSFDPEEHPYLSPFTKGLRSTAPSMLGASLTALAAPLGAAVGISAGTWSLVGSLAVSSVYGLSKWEEVYEEALARGLTQEEARMAAHRAGAGEFGLEVLGNYLGMFGWVARGGKPLTSTAGKVLSDIAIKPTFKKLLVKGGVELIKSTASEVATELLQDYWEWQVKFGYGIEEQYLALEDLRDTAIATMGSVVVSGLLGSPSVIATEVQQQKRNNMIRNLLTDPNAPMRQRQLAADMVYKILEETAGKPAAKNFAANWEQQKNSVLPFNIEGAAVKNTSDTNFVTDFLDTLTAEVDRQLTGGNQEGAQYIVEKVSSIINLKKALKDAGKDVDVGITNREWQEIIKESSDRRYIEYRERVRRKQEGAEKWKQRQERAQHAEVEGQPQDADSKPVDVNDPKSLLKHINDITEDDDASFRATENAVSQGNDDSLTKQLSEEMNKEPVQLDSVFASENESVNDVAVEYLVGDEQQKAATRERWAQLQEENVVPADLSIEEYAASVQDELEGEQASQRKSQEGVATFTGKGTQQQNLQTLTTAQSLTDRERFIKAWPEFRNKLSVQNQRVADALYAIIMAETQDAQDTAIRNFEAIQQDIGGEVGVAVEVAQELVKAVLGQESRILFTDTTETLEGSDAGRIGETAVQTGQEKGAEGGTPRQVHIRNDAKARVETQARTPEATEGEGGATPRADQRKIIPTPQTPTDATQQQDEAAYAAQPVVEEGQFSKQRQIVPPPASDQAAASEQAKADGRSRLVLRLGRSRNVLGTHDTRLPARYAVVKLSDLQPSHLPLQDFAVNEAYPLKNTRAYDAATAEGESERSKVRAIKNRFDAERAVSSDVQASVGPPTVALVINRDGSEHLVALGGNARTMAMQMLSQEQLQALFLQTNEEASLFGLDLLQSPDEVVVRYLGEFDLRQPGVEVELQRLVDILNPSPGQVQTTRALALADAESNVAPADLLGKSANMAEDEAAALMGELIHKGKIDSNTRRHLASSSANAVEYIRRLLIHVAFRNQHLTDYAQEIAQQKLPGRALIEAAAPAMIEMRNKGETAIPDAVATAFGEIIEYLGRGYALPKAIRQAAIQLHLDANQDIILTIAEALNNRVVLDAGGRIRTDATIHEFTKFWDSVQLTVQKWIDQEDLFGNKPTLRQTLETVFKNLRNKQIYGNEQIQTAKRRRSDEGGEIRAKRRRRARGPLMQQREFNLNDEFRLVGEPLYTPEQLAEMEARDIARRDADAQKRMEAATPMFSFMDELDQQGREIRRSEGERRIVPEPRTEEGAARRGRITKEMSLEQVVRHREATSDQLPPLDEAVQKRIDADTRVALKTLHIKQDQDLAQRYIETLVKTKLAGYLAAGKDIDSFSFSGIARQAAIEFQRIASAFGRQGPHTSLDVIMEDGDVVPMTDLEASADTRQPLSAEERAADRAEYQAIISKEGNKNQAKQKIIDIYEKKIRIDIKDQQEVLKNDIAFAYVTGENQRARDAAEQRWYAEQDAGRIAEHEDIRDTAADLTERIRKERIGLEQDQGPDGVHNVAILGGEQRGLTETSERQLLPPPAPDRTVPLQQQAEQQQAATVAQEQISRGKVQARDIQQRIDQETKNWKGKPKGGILVVQSVEEATQKLKLSEHSQEILRDGEVEGFYHLQSDTVVIIADRVASVEDGVAVALWHETLHTGLRAVLGENFTAELDAIGELIPREELEEIAKWYELDLLKVNDYREAVEEYLAHRSEKRNPTLRDKFVAAIKRGLRAIGLSESLVDFMDKRGEIDQLIDASMEHMKYGRRAQKTSISEQALGGMTDAQLANKIEQNIVKEKPGDLPQEETRQKKKVPVKPADRDAAAIKDEITKVTEQLGKQIAEFTKKQQESRAIVAVGKKMFPAAPQHTPIKYTKTKVVPHRIVEQTVALAINLATEEAVRLNIEKQSDRYKLMRRIYGETQRVLKGIFAEEHDITDKKEVKKIKGFEVTRHGMAEHINAVADALNVRLESILLQKNLTTEEQVEAVRQTIKDTLNQGKFDALSKMQGFHKIDSLERAQSLVEYFRRDSHRMMAEELYDMLESVKQPKDLFQADSRDGDYYAQWNEIADKFDPDGKKRQLKRKEFLDTASDSVETMLDIYKQLAQVKAEAREAKGNWREGKYKSQQHLTETVQSELNATEGKRGFAQPIKSRDVEEGSTPRRRNLFKFLAWDWGARTETILGSLVERTSAMMDVLKHAISNGDGHHAEVVRSMRNPVYAILSKLTNAEMIRMSNKPSVVPGLRNLLKGESKNIKIAFTDMEKATIYAMMKRINGFNKLLMNGFVLERNTAPTQADVIGGVRNGYTVQETIAILDLIIGSMSTTTRQLADTMVEVFSNPELRAALNEVARREVGYDLFTEEIFFPMFASHEQTFADVESEAVKGMKRGIGVPGWTKPVVKHKHAMRVGNALAIFMQRSNEIAHYVATRETAKRAFNLLQDSNVKRAIVDRLGESAWEFLQETVCMAAGFERTRSSSWFAQQAQRVTISRLYGRPTTYAANRYAAIPAVINFISRLPGSKPALVAELAGRLMSPIFLEEHIHLNKENAAWLKDLKERRAWMENRWHGDLLSSYAPVIRRDMRFAMKSQAKLATYQLGQFGLQYLANAEMRLSLELYKVLVKRMGYDRNTAAQLVEAQLREAQNSSSVIDDTRAVRFVKQKGLSWIFPFISQSMAYRNMLMRDLQLFAQNPSTETFRNVGKSALMVLSTQTITFVSRNFLRRAARVGLIAATTALAHSVLGIDPDDDEEEQHDELLKRGIMELVYMMDLALPVIGKSAGELVALIIGIGNKRDLSSTALSDSINQFVRGIQKLVLLVGDQEYEPRDGTRAEAWWDVVKKLSTGFDFIGIGTGGPTQRVEIGWHTIKDIIDWLRREQKSSWP